MKNATEFIKKHLLSLLCGVVALLAVIALFYPLGGKKEKLAEKLQTQASVLQTLQSLSNKPRTLPIIDPANPTPLPLNRFPNQQIINEAQTIPAAFRAQAQVIATTALKINLHQPLVSGALPYPASSIDAFNFREAYRQMMTPNAGRLYMMMRAGHPPTPDEITAAENELYQKEYVPQLVYPPNAPPGTPAMNAEQIQTAFEVDKATMPAREIQRVASTCMVYVDPTAFTLSGAPTLPVTSMGSSPNAPSPEDMWYAQLGLWMQADVANAIIRTNEPFKNVTQAPVKRLLKVLIDMRPYIVPANYLPSPPTETNDQLPVPKDTTVTPTGRECNQMYDVAHFDLIVDMEADKIPWLLDELGNGQFITVLKCDVKPVDSGVDQTQGFIYGTKPVAQLHLVCEEIFLRNWCRKLMPKEVAANLLGVSTVSGGSAYSPDMEDQSQMGAPPGGPGVGPGRY